MDGTTLGVYTIRDSKAEAYMQPFTFRTDAEAIRAFGDSVEKAGTPLHDHPEDYFLYKVGEFDLLVGVIKPLEIVNLAGAADFRKE